MLKKLGVFVKIGRFIKLNPLIFLDFSKDLLLEIKLTYGEASINVAEGVADKKNSN